MKENKNETNKDQQPVAKTYDKRHSPDMRNMHGRESKKNSSGNQGSEK